MEDILVPIALFAFMSWALVTITRTISNNRTRRRILEARASSELVDAVFTARLDSDSWSSLKWGIITVVVGVALMVLEVLPFGAESPFTYGFVLLAAGLALLIYHLIAKRQPASLTAAQRGMLPHVTAVGEIPSRVPAAEIPPRAEAVRTTAGRDE
jgi:hypothetical protein